LVCSQRQNLVDQFHISKFRGHVEGIGLPPGQKGRFMFDQQMKNLDGALLCGDQNRATLVSIQGLNISAEFEKLGNHVDVICPAGQVQGGFSVLIRGFAVHNRCIAIITPLVKPADCRDTATLGCDVQGIEATRGAGFNQLLAEFYRPSKSKLVLETSWRAALRYISSMISILPSSARRCNMVYYGVSVAVRSQRQLF